MLVEVDHHVVHDTVLADADLRVRVGLVLQAAAAVVLVLEYLVQGRRGVLVATAMRACRDPQLPEPDAVLVADVVPTVPEAALVQVRRPATDAALPRFLERVLQPEQAAVLPEEDFHVVVEVCGFSVPLHVDEAVLVERVVRAQVLRCGRADEAPHAEPGTKGVPVLLHFHVAVRGLEGHGVLEEAPVPEPVDPLECVDVELGAAVRDHGEGP